MNKDQLAIATITLARNEEEETLLMKALSTLAECGVTTYITDGGSTENFTSFLKTFPNFKLSDTTIAGVFAQVRNSLKDAYDSKSPFILYTEPDKFDFFATSLNRWVAEISVGTQTGIINAARTDYAFRTFPAFQQMTETTINNCCAEITGVSADFTYGPFLMNRDVVPHLKQVTQDIGWGWRPYIFNIAKRLGLTIYPYTGDFVCPSDQRNDDTAERIYRMRQLKENIDGIMLSTMVSL
jgi:hypothetical protein